MLKLHSIKQWDGNACGPASIEMTAGYLGVPLARATIAKVSRYRQRQGLSNVELVETLRDLGFGVRAKSLATWADLRAASRSQKSVAIVSWMLDGYIGHFSVVEKVTADGVYLADPLSGKIVRLQRIAFLRLWLDYDELWYPRTNGDIQLRWIAVVSAPRRKARNK